MRRRERERRYQAVFESIARLEFELGLSEAPPRQRGFRSAADLEQRWRASAIKSAEHYAAALTSARAQAGATESEPA